MEHIVVAAVARSVTDLLIRDVLAEQVCSILGVRQNIDDIREQFIRIKRVLKAADKKPDQQDIQIWVSDLREIAYDAEDVIRTFSIKIAPRISNPVKRYAWYSGQLPYLSKVAFKIKAIKAKISGLYEFANNNLKLTSAGEDSSSSAFYRKQYSHEIEDTVGLKRNIEELVEDLEDDCRHGYVVSICGMPGIGKTTLARKLYNNDRIRHYFDCFGWASISQICNPDDAWKKILFQLVSPSQEEREYIKGLNNDELADKLYQVQMKDKCLVILDDIWKEEDWEKLRHAFPTGGKGRSRILLTTRNMELASSASGGRPHVPQFLTTEEGWELFRRKAFPEVNNNPDFTVCEVKENLGKEIVKKCDGLPLAIVVLGGLLATKEELHEWERMNRYKLEQPKGHEHHNTILWEVMALSYNELPHDLKPCFLYLSHFPEDAAIPRKKLIQLWIAEGIVSQDEQKQEQVLEDLAEDYLVYLINRCMVQVGDFGSTGRIKTCRLHDFMREFCLKKAKNENFLKHIHYPNESDDAPSSSLPSGKTRRLAIYLPADVDRLMSSRHKEYSKLRSLLYFHGKTCSVNDWRLIKKILNLKILRVLDLEGVKGPYGELPREIGHLIQLQFLSLKKTGFGVLPSSIGNLIFLKTLNLQTISKFSRDSTVQIPNVIWKMKWLTHLYFPKWCGNMVDKLQLSNLNRLQTLVNFPANKCDVRELLKLANLRKLVLNDPGHFRSFVEIFNPPNDVTLRRLHSLSLKSETLTFPDEVVDVGQLLSSCPDLEKLHVEGRIETLPEFRQLTPHLAKLTLWGSNLVEDPIPTLEKLPNLRILSGWQMFVGKKMEFSDKGFPKLRILLLRGLPDFEVWVMEKGAMPSLYRLEISNCNKLKTIPDAISSVETLQELEICGCLFKIKIGPEGEDFAKVKHVPSIVIRN